MIADDLFAGAGGWDLAAAQLGIHARGVENMKEARATRDAAGLTTIHDDVWTFKPRYLGRDLTADGLIASPPCQTFSAAGKGSGRKALDDVLALMPEVKHMSLADLREAGKAFGDDRTALVLTPLWFALHHPYQWLAWEQVPTVLPVWQACADILHVEGWSVWSGNLQAEQYGVPQTRKRAFLLASRTGDVAPPTPTHSRYHSRSPERLDEGVQKWVSMAEGLGWGLTKRPSPTVTGGGTETGGAEPIAKLARYTDRADWAPRDTELASRRDAPSWIAEHGTRENRKADRPAPTITGESHRWGWCASPSGITGPVHRPATHPAATVTGAGNYETHPTTACRQSALESVRLTVSEAGILQSFPADYPWQGNKGKQFLQAGNAVPPGLALHALAAAAGIETRKEVAA